MRDEEKEFEPLGRWKMLAFHFGAASAHGMERAISLMKIKRHLFIVFGTIATAVISQGAVVLTEDFTYSNGALVTVSSGAWATHSGTALQVEVVNGAATITGAESEDVNKLFTGGALSTGTLSATFDVTFTTLPTGAGTYFTHFKDATTGFTSRLFATTTGAATGSFRLGISNSTNTVAIDLSDLSLNTLYQITLNSDLDTNASSFSVGAGPTITATDATLNLAITAFALRQSANMGAVTVDNIVVNYVIPEPTTTLLGALSCLAILRRRR